MCVCVGVYVLLVHDRQPTTRNVVAGHKLKARQRSRTRSATKFGYVRNGCAAEKWRTWTFTRRPRRTANQSTIGVARIFDCGGSPDLLCRFSSPRLNINAKRAYGRASRILCVLLSTMLRKLLSTVCVSVSISHCISYYAPLLSWIKNIRGLGVPGLPFGYADEIGTCHHPRMAATSFLRAPVSTSRLSRK